MSAKSENIFCAFEMGEIFPSAVLNQKMSSKEQSGKESKVKYIRTCHQEMLDNYNHTH